MTSGGSYFLYPHISSPISQYSLPILRNPLRTFECSMSGNPEILHLYLVHYKWKFSKGFQKGQGDEQRALIPRSPSPKLGSMHRNPISSTCRRTWGTKTNTPKSCSQAMTHVGQLNIEFSDFLYALRNVSNLELRSSK